MACFEYKFYPNFVPGLQLWLDASDSSTLYQDSAGTTPATADGDPIGCWKDKSGNGNNFSESDGTRKPSRKDSVKNGRNGVRFDGTNDRLVGGDILDLGTSNLYVFAVVKMISNDGFIISKTRYAYVNQRWELGRLNGFGSTGDIWANCHPSIGGQVSVYGGTVNTTDYRCLSFFIDKSGSPFVKVNINSVLFGSTNGSADTGNYNTTNSCVIGSFPDGNGNPANNFPLNGDICEIVLYIKSEMNSVMIKSVENYLLSKWGLP